MIFSIAKYSTGETIYFKEKKEYVVGRKNCEVLLQNDQSVSRKHAIFQVKKDQVTIKDCNSKYHTLHNGNQMDPEVEVKLNHMDTLQFGIYENKFRFECYKWIVAASSLSSDNKTALKNALQKCEAKYSDNWSDNCTHLTVDKLTLTPKVLHALIDGKPMVSLKYWLDYAHSLEKKLALPDIENYKNPPVGEQLLSSNFSFNYDPRRNTLFENKTFIFLKPSIKNQMEEVIKKCGGTCIAWETEPKTIFEMNKSHIEYIVVRVDTSDEDNASFKNLLKEYVKDKRSISLSEIPLAIVHCSSDVNCNPSFNKASQVFQRQSQRYQAKDVLVPETETMNVLGPDLGKVIPPSLEENVMDVKLPDLTRLCNVSASNKRGNIEESAQEREAKRKKLDKGHKKQKAPGQPTLVSFIGRKSSTSLDSNGSKTKSSGTVKRKASDEPDTSPCLKSNPFSVIKSTSAKRSKPEEDHNPFQLNRSSRTKSGISRTDNPFADIKTSTSTRNPSSSEENITEPKKEPNVLRALPFKKEPRLLFPIKSDILYRSTSKRTNSISSWISKNSMKRQIIVDKIEDPETAKYIEAFKNCVRIRPLPIFERTIIDLKETNENYGVKNFKTFKKIQPLKPQVTVYSWHQLRRIALGDLTGIDVNPEENSDNEEQPQASKNSASSKTSGKAKPRGKRFVL